MKTKKTFLTIALMVGAVLPFTATSCGDNDVEDSCSSIKVLFSQKEEILGQVAADIPHLSITKGFAIILDISSPRYGL